MSKLRITTLGLTALLTLAPALVQAQDGYRIRPGDVLRVDVLEDPNLSRPTLVSPDGRVSLPMAGAVPAAGMTVEQVQQSLATKLAGNFAAPPSVYVSVERLAEPRGGTGGAAVAARGINVYVMGEAGRPGKHAVARGTTLMQVFAEAGGFSKFASTKRIQLRRVDAKTGAEQVYAIDYDAIERGASRSGTTVLRDGDVIVVPQRRLFE